MTDRVIKDILIILYILVIPMWLMEFLGIDMYLMKADERKKGKWIGDSDIPDRLICSCCDSQYDMYFLEQDDMHYCPNCGAEMEGEE